MKKIKGLKMFLESYSDNPESYSKTLLKKIQRKINTFFGENIDKIVSFDDYVETDAKTKKEKNLSDMGLELLDSTIYTKSPMVDTLRVIFNEGDNRYDLYIKINLKESIKDTSVDEFSIKDIKFAYAKLKKYILTEDNIELLGELDKKIQIGDISQDFLIEFKVELDDFFDSENDDDFSVLSKEELREEEESKEEEEGSNEDDESENEPEEFVDEEF